MTTFLTKYYVKKVILAYHLLILNIYILRYATSLNDVANSEYLTAFFNETYDRDLTRYPNIF